MAGPDLPFGVDPPTVARTRRPPLRGLTLPPARGEDRAYPPKRCKEANSGGPRPRDRGDDVERSPDVSDGGAPETDVIDQEPASRGHGSESFFILGEGLVSTSRGGREDAPAQPAAAAVAAAQAPPFRFTRSGPKGGRISRPARRKIAKAMTDGGGTDSDIPAGYTYLGQFIDHDLTFDRTEVMLGEDIAPPDMLQGRSPSLDLDSLYGAGPDDPVSEKFYEADGRRLKMGKTQGLGRAAVPGARRLRPAAASRPQEGDDPGLPQRREPRRRADPPRLHPLPQPRRRRSWPTCPPASASSAPAAR